MKIIAPLKNTFHNTDALHNSSNINELVKTVLNYSFIIFFYEKISQLQKSTNKQICDQK